MKKFQAGAEAKQPMSSDNLLRENLRFARQLLGGKLSAQAAQSLRTLSRDFRFSLRSGELKVIDNSWYVTHTGLLSLARRRKCRGIHVETVDSLCDSAMNRFVLKATAFPFKDSSGFVGYGDADPSNVSSNNLRYCRARDIRAGSRRQFFPLAGGSEAVEIDERDAVPHGMADLDHTAESRQSFFVYLFMREEFRVIEKVAQEPTQLPHRFLCAVQTTDDALAR